MQAVTVERTITSNEVASAIIAIKMSVNQRLYEKGLITEEMYTRAKDMILKGEMRHTYPLRKL